MSKYYIDGFTIGSNPSKEGGYTITNEYGDIIKQKYVNSERDDKPITNNYTEFLALHDCLIDFCKKNDLILTDSTNNIAWANLHFNKKSKRRDLIPMAQRVNTQLKKLAIGLSWIPRDANLAGLVNEKLFK